MDVFRITHKKWAGTLQGSGYAARWNSNGFFVIYCAANCSLACLENLVHRNGFGNDDDYSLMTILIPKNVKTSVIEVSQLPIGWNDSNEKAHLICRKIGDEWIRSMKSSILIVPSAIIPNENNILINPNHRDFTKIVISDVAPFRFDKRFNNK
jgi:RES domain-containing protein